MIQSMTAFARLQKHDNFGVFCWEIRSVNHRYLDVSFRLPESLRSIETTLRSTLRDTVHRGKLECQLKYQDTNPENQSMLINIGMVNALSDLANQLVASHQLANDLKVSQVLAWPGVVQSRTLDTDKLSHFAVQTFEEAIQQLLQMRIQEGVALKAHVEDRLTRLQDEVNRSKILVRSLAKQNKEKLMSRLESIRIEVPEARVDQEIALTLARLDVSEELDRLSMHIDEVSRALRSEKVAGRRLDFLMQELNREANTLSSKSDSAELTRHAVEMKVLIEQMREQIQNIE